MTMTTRQGEPAQRLFASEHEGSLSESSSGGGGAVLIPESMMGQYESGDIEDAGYMWRKYGEKTVGRKATAVRRSYYRCIGDPMYPQCTAKKRIDNLTSAAPNQTPLSILYINNHNHPPRSQGLDPGTTSRQYTQFGGTDCPRPALESLKPEELALEMYNDLMVQLESSNNNAVRDDHAVASSESSRGPPGLQEAHSLSVDAVASIHINEHQQIRSASEHASEEYISEKEAQDLLECLLRGSSYCARRSQQFP